MQERDINKKQIGNPDNSQDEDQHREMLAPFALLRPYSGDDESKHIDNRRAKNSCHIRNTTPSGAWQNDAGAMVARKSDESGARESGSRGGPGGGESREDNEDRWKLLDGTFPIDIVLRYDGHNVPPLRGFLALSTPPLDNKQEVLLKATDYHSLEATLNNIRTTQYSVGIPAAFLTPPVGSTDECILKTSAHYPALDEPRPESSLSSTQGFVANPQPSLLKYENYSSCQMHQANLQALEQLEVERCMKERENLYNAIDGPEMDAKSRPEWSGLFHLGNDWVINTDLLFLERQRSLIQARRRVIKDEENWTGGDDKSSKEDDCAKEARRYWTKGIQIDLGHLYKHLFQR